MLLDLIDLSKLRRTIVYGALLAVVFILQDLILSRIAAFGAKPLLIPAVVVGVGLFEGGVWGGCVGLAAGYFADMTSQHVALFTVLLPILGFFAGVLGKYMLHRGFMSYMVLALVALATAAFCQMFRFLFLMDEDARQFLSLYLPGREMWPVWRMGLTQTAVSLAWAVPFYFPCKFIAASPLGR